MLTNIFQFLGACCLFAAIFAGCCLDSEVWLPFAAVVVLGFIGLGIFGKAAEWSHDWGW